MYIKTNNNTTFIITLFKNFMEQKTRKKHEYKSLVEYMKVRNEMLKSMFVDNGFDVKIIGDDNQPIIIVIGGKGEKTFAIAGFVKNFNYNFCDKPFGGRPIRTINLKEDNITRDELIDLIEESEVRKVYTISDLRTGGDSLFSYIKTEDDKSMTFVWSNDNPRYFLSKPRLFNTVDILEKNNYLVQINNLSE